MLKKTIFVIFVLSLFVIPINAEAGFVDFSVVNRGNSWDRLQYDGGTLRFYTSGSKKGSAEFETKAIYNRPGHSAHGSAYNMKVRLFSGGGLFDQPEGDIIQWVPGNQELSVIFDQMQDLGPGASWRWAQGAMNLDYISGNNVTDFDDTAHWWEDYKPDAFWMDFEEVLPPDENRPGKQVFGVEGVLQGYQRIVRNGGIWTKQVESLPLDWEVSRITSPPLDPNGVPEPGTMALMGFGLSGMGFLRRKKKRAK